MQRKNTKLSKEEREQLMDEMLSAAYTSGFDMDHLIRDILSDEAKTVVDKKGPYELAEEKFKDYKDQFPNPRDELEKRKSELEKKIRS